MTAGLVNLIVLIAVLAIVSVVVAIFLMARSQRGTGRKMRTGKVAQIRPVRVNPKTGDIIR